MDISVEAVELPVGMPPLATPPKRTPPSGRVKSDGCGEELSFVRSAEGGPKTCLQQRARSRTAKDDSPKALHAKLIEVV